MGPRRVFVLSLALLLTLGAGTAAARKGPSRKAPTLTPEEYFDAATKRILGEAQGSEDGWERLVYLCDRIGHRLSGSPQLQEAVDWAAYQLAKDGLQVILQPVTVPRWVRGSASLTELAPVERGLPVLALGDSIGTGVAPVEADVLVVRSFEEATERADEAAGRILVWNVPFTDYGETVQYRTRGASEASRLGAVASLVRSVSPTSLNTPHAGNQAYADDVEPIPTAAITIEDAEHLQRVQDRGTTPRLRLELGCRNDGEAPSHNVIADVRGRSLPEEVVVVSGHLDSWDVGQGAQDDGAGVVMAMEVGRILASLPTPPRRTVRIVLWTNEENGLAGAREYAAQEASRLGNHVAALEADTGGGPTAGWRVHMADDSQGERALSALEPLVGLLAPLSAGGLRLGYAGADVGPMVRAGVLGLGLDLDTTGYWPIHHTEADTVEKIDPAVFRRDAAVMALTAFWLAETERRPVPFSPPGKEQP